VIEHGPVRYSRDSYYKTWYWSNFVIFLSAVFAVVILLSKSFLWWPLAKILALLIAGIFVGSYLLSFIMLFFLKCNSCSKYLYEPWKLLVFEKHPRNIEGLFKFHCEYCGQKYFISDEENDS